jgi:two-component system sensor histidine kinase and response regulator WspE
MRVAGCEVWVTARLPSSVMPRMDGIEMIGLLKKNPRLASLPVMIVSYKEREEDRRRGLDAGADYYLTKSSFHDESLLRAVVDLIGEAEG